MAGVHKKDTALNTILQQKLVPLYYHPSAEVSINIMQALYAAGIRVIEYTHRGENAFSNFEALRKAKEQKGLELQLGIGTIKNSRQARQYIDAGVDFIVCPTTNEEVAAATQAAGLLWIPGCMTPTEIAVAESAGARLVKIFPGNIIGPAFISAVKELFPDLQFMPTGGVEAEESNLRAWFNAGAVAVGMGSKLIKKELVQREDYKGLQTTTTNALQLINRVAFTPLK